MFLLAFFVPAAGITILQVAANPYVTELGDPQTASSRLNLTHAQAANYVSFYWGGAMVGRFIGFAVMRRASPGKALAFNAACSIALIMVAVFGSGKVAMRAILAVGLCNSIMFPTIFSMAIVGGALVPFAQGFLADTAGLQLSFLVPAACYTFILYYGLRYAGMYQQK